MRGSVQLLLLLTFFTSISNAQTNYYVNNSQGSDISINGSGPSTSAWKTIEYAVNNVSNPSTDQIIINISGDVYDLSNDQIDINRNFFDLTLLGEGIDHTFIQSAADPSFSSSRVIKIYSGNNILLKKLTVRYGRIVAPNVNGGGILNNGGMLIIDYCKVTENLGGSVGYGGGISNMGGNLTISNSIVSYNTSNDSCYGAGIGSRNGTLNIYYSTISFNAALSAGGIAVISNNADAIFNMENSTVYGNTAGLRFSAIRFSIFGSDSFDITANINSCTIYNNSTLGTFGGIGLASVTNFNIKNSIVAGNTSQGVLDDLRGTSLIPISITSGGYNIFQSIKDVTINGEQNNGIGLNPNLLLLADNNSNNGTQTCATQIGSPAIDQIPIDFKNGAPTLDQRGFQRDGNYDIGSYEYSNISLINEDINKFTNFDLDQNYPNPFNPNTKIRYTIPSVSLSSSSRAESRGEGSLVTLKVYDVLGNEVAELVNEEKLAGNYEIDFNVAHESFRAITSGVYFYQLRAGSFVETKKMILMK